MTDSSIATVGTNTVSITEMWNTTRNSVSEPWDNMSLSTAGSNGQVSDESLSTSSLDFSTGGILTTTTNSTIAADLNCTGTYDNFTDSFANVTDAVASSSTYGSTGESMTTSGGDATAVAVAAAVFMAMFTLVALAGNVCCLIALTHKNMEKICVLYSFLSNICAIQLCDSLLTMPLILGASASGTWPYGSFMCQLSAFFLNLLNVQTIMALALLALDRLLAVRWPNTYSNMNRLKASLITGYTWLHGTAFTVVILAGVVPSEYLPDCYLCSVSSQTGHVYPVFFSLFCYIFPLLIIISMYVVIIKVAVEEKPTVQNFHAEVNYANRLGRRSKLWRELRGAKTSGALVVLWCLFQGPYLAMQFVYLYGNSGYSSENNNLFSTPLKTALTWMRFCYPWLVPTVVFIGFPEVREELSNTCACHKSNMVDSGRQEILAKPGVLTSWASDASSSRPSTLGHSFQIPVLFATSGGLRLQIGNKQRENDVDKAVYFQDEFYPDPRMKYDSTNSRYPPPLTPVPQNSDEDTSGSWDINGAVRGDSPEPEEIAQEAAHISTRSPSDPDRGRPASSTSSSFQLSLTSRELKLHRSTSRTPNGGPPHSPVVTPRQKEPETPPGSIPPSQSNAPR